MWVLNKELIISYLKKSPNIVKGYTLIYASMKKINRLTSMLYLKSVKRKKNRIGHMHLKQKEMGKKRKISKGNYLNIYLK